MIIAHQQIIRAESPRGRVVQPDLVGIGFRHAVFRAGDGFEFLVGHGSTSMPANGVAGKPENV